MYNKDRSIPEITIPNERLDNAKQEIERLRLIETRIKNRIAFYSNEIKTATFMGDDQRAFTLNILLNELKEVLDFE